MLCSGCSCFACELRVTALSAFAVPVAQPVVHAIKESRLENKVKRESIAGGPRSSAASGTAAVKKIARANTDESDSTDSDDE